MTVKGLTSRLALAARNHHGDGLQPGDVYFLHGDGGVGVVYAAEGVFLVGVIVKPVFFNHAEAVGGAN